MANQLILEPVGVYSAGIEIDQGETWPAISGDGPGINQFQGCEMNDGLKVHVTVDDESMSIGRYDGIQFLTPLDGHTLRPWPDFP